MIAANKIKKACEQKLDISFRSGAELNGWCEINGVKACRVTVSKGNKDVARKTFRRIAEGLYLSDAELLLFSSCKLSGNDIRKMIIERKPILPS